MNFKKEGFWGRNTARLPETFFYAYFVEFVLTDPFRFEMSESCQRQQVGKSFEFLAVHFVSNTDQLE